MSEFIKKRSIATAAPVSLPQLFLDQRENEEHGAVLNAADNILLDKAVPLFAIAARLQLMPMDIDPVVLQQQLLAMLAQYEQELQHHNIRAEHIFLVKYFLCALLDEIIDYDVFQNTGLWRSYSLLLHFFHEGNADERFFILLDRLLAEPSMNLALLEFAYMVLIYGYQGKYRDLNNGRVTLLEKTDQLYHVLSWHHGDIRKSLLVQHYS